MPHHKSCKKRVKTSVIQRDRNRGYRSQLRAAIRDLRAETNKETAATRYREVTSIIDNAVTRRLLHKRNADRNKSRLALFVKKLN
ncbi:MAG: 30S ribosomal protein S20 [bacterium]